MASRNDPSTDPEREAERLLEELGMDSLPIDPFAIAHKLGIVLRPLPNTDGGTNGMLLLTRGATGIAYPTHVRSKGFRKFSVAHEIGHFRLPGHIDAVIGADGKHVSGAPYQSNDRYEREADAFAAALLMPEKLFTAAAEKAGTGLEAIEALSKLCETSLESTANRFAQTSRHPVAVILSRDNVIQYVVMSEPLKKLDGVEWIRKNTPLPPGSVTAHFNSDPAQVYSRGRDRGWRMHRDWFDGMSRVEILEEVVGLGSYYKTLTVLTGMRHPTEEEIYDIWMEIKDAEAAGRRID